MRYRIRRRTARSDWNLLCVAGKLRQKILVPERAMVPRCENQFFFVHAMPVSAIVSVCFSSSRSSRSAIELEALVRLVDERQVPQFVERVGRHSKPARGGRFQDASKASE